MKHKWNEESLRDLYYTQGKTLEEIGLLYEVTRERIRQVMDFYNIPRIATRNRVSEFGHKGYKPRYKSLGDYVRGTYSLCSSTLRTYLKILDMLHCSECGSKENIHIHHISYPAKSMEDIQVFCASCHKLKHTKGMTLIKQIDLFNDYESGMKGKDMANKYHISKPYVDKIIKKIKNNWHTLRE